MKARGDRQHKSTLERPKDCSHLWEKYPELTPEYTHRTYFVDLFASPPDKPGQCGFPRFSASVSPAALVSEFGREFVATSGKGVSTGSAITEAFREMGFVLAAH